MRDAPYPQPKPVAQNWRGDLTRLPQLTFPRRVFRSFAYGLLKLVAWCCLSIEVEGAENLPKKGPLLLAINHLGDSDAPALVSKLPAPPDAIAKVELYDLPILGKLMDYYGVIWVHRGRPDKRALRAALDGLKEGRIIIIAPEGRQSLTGALEEGNGGAAFLAYKSGAPILPVAITGTENSKVYGRIKRLKRASVRIKVGGMFHLAAEKSDRHGVIEHGTNHIMKALAALLPPEYRGAYELNPQPPS